MKLPQSLAVASLLAWSSQVPSAPPPRLPTGTGGLAKSNGDSHCPRARGRSAWKASARAWCAPGWTLESCAEGDLDQDGLGDLAVVCGHHHPKALYTPEEEDSTPLVRYQVRIGLQGRDKGPRWVWASDGLVPSWNDSSEMAPFDAVAVVGGDLEISWSQIMAMGSWAASKHLVGLVWQGDHLEVARYLVDSWVRTSDVHTVALADYRHGRAVACHRDGESSKDSLKPDFPCADIPSLRQVSLSPPPLPRLEGWEPSRDLDPLLSLLPEEHTDDSAPTR